ncbi:MAG: hypothetical protein JJT85_07785 [Chromatiales bacterium]|nr:hypothetical protein [Chromatiales bacterium]
MQLAPAELLLSLVFAPLLAAIAAVMLGARAGRLLAVMVCLVLAIQLLFLGQRFSADGPFDLALAGIAPPLGIRLALDGLNLLLLWLVTLVYLGTSLHAWASIGAGARGTAFWPPWLLMLSALNGLLLSGDLFTMYIGLEIASLSGISLIALDRKADALRAAMRYLLLAMLGSLVYLLGVAVVYAITGALDFALAGSRLPGGAVTIAALLLMTGGLLLKSAIFPLHGWLPPAHGSAPPPESAVLSALLVKVSLYMLYRIWFWMEVPVAGLVSAGQLLAAMGAGALVYGSIAALRQQQLKYLVAYSTVAQLGYLMLVFALPGAWQGTIYHLLAHGLAKAAMFLAAGNMIWALGSDRLDRLPGLDRHIPASVFAFALAAVSLMGLPPSGGFTAKWLMLTAAWAAQAWVWVLLLLTGSLLTAAYLFRVFALTFAPRSPRRRAQPVRRPHPLMELSALALAMLAIGMGFSGTPLLDVLALPPQLLPGAAPGLPAPLHLTPGAP